MATTIVLKDNSREIRDRIRDAGIGVCICAYYNGAAWLDFHVGVTDEVHGVGYTGGEFGDITQEERLAQFEYEARNGLYIVCKDVEEFINEIKKRNGKKESI